MTTQDIHIGERLTTPQTHRTLIGLHSGHIITTGPRRSGTRRQIPEHQHVHFRARKTEPVPAANQFDRATAAPQTIIRLQVLANPAHMRLHQLHRRTRWRIPPQHINERVPAHQHPRVHHQQAKHGTPRSRPEIKRRPIPPRLNRPKHPQPQTRTSF